MLVVVPVVELGGGQRGFGLHRHIEDSGGGCHLDCWESGFGEVMFVDDNVQRLRFLERVKWGERREEEKEILGRNPAVLSLPHHCPMELTGCYVVLHFGTLAGFFFSHLLLHARSDVIT